MIVVFALLLVNAFVPNVSAHRSGCHRWHSCPSDSGSYVCGDLGYTSECGTSSYSAPTYTPPAPHIPVVTTKKVTSSESIPFAHKVRYTSKEYPDYIKTTTTGAPGVKQITTEITFSDGVETSRKIVSSEATQQTIDEVVTQGKRHKPSAKLTAVKKTNHKNKFNINGRAKENSVVVLSLDGKRIKRAKVDNKGNFSFRNIKITNHSAKIEIFIRVKNKETKISEPYTVVPSKKSFISEYQSQHSKK